MEEVPPTKVEDDCRPIDKKPAGKREFGTLAGKLIITGDIISPAFDASDWDCLKD
jgi:hypothetical protein